MYKASSVRCQRCTKKKKNKKKIMLRCIIITACAIQFLHYIPLYRNIQHYATLNCSVKRVYGTEAHKTINSVYYIDANILTKIIDIIYYNCIEMRRITALHLILLPISVIFTDQKSEFSLLGNYRRSYRRFVTCPE